MDSIFDLAWSNVILPANAQHTVSNRHEWPDLRALVQFDSFIYNYCAHCDDEAVHRVNILELAVNSHGCRKFGYILSDSGDWFVNNFLVQLPERGDRAARTRVRVALLLDLGADWTADRPAA